MPVDSVPMPFVALPSTSSTRPRGSGVGRHPDDLLALCLVHGEEALQQFVCAVDELLDGRVQVVADLLREQHGGVFEVGQAALRGGIALVRFLRKRGVFLPRVDGHGLCLGEQLVGVDRAQQRVAQADLRDADLLQRGDGRNTRLVHLRKPHDKCLKRGGGVAVPQRLEALRRHAGHAGEILQRLSARFGGDLHVDQRLGNAEPPISARTPTEDSAAAKPRICGSVSPTWWPAAQGAATCS